MSEGLTLKTEQELSACLWVLEAALGRRPPLGVKTTGDNLPEFWARLIELGM